MRTPHDLVPRRHITRLLACLFLCFAAAGCSDDAGGPGASVDVDESDATSPDVASVDADAGAPDATSDEDTGRDSGVDAAPDAGRDAHEDATDGGGEDTGRDAAPDAGEPDAHMTWKLDGQVVYEATSYEAGHVSGGVYVYMPHWGRNVQIDITNASSTGTVDLACGDDWGSANMGLTTSDNGHSGLDDVPSEWQQLLLNEHHCDSGTTDGDQLTRWQLELSHVSSSRVAGSFAMTIVGAQERAGSTLTIEGQFDVEPDA
jgi:hypothetical protein